MVETVLTGDTPAATGEAPAKKRRTRRTAGEDQGEVTRSAGRRSRARPADTSGTDAGSTTDPATAPVRSRRRRAPAPLSEGSASVLQPNAGEGDDPPPPIADTTSPHPDAAPAVPAPVASTDSADVRPVIPEERVHLPEPLEEVAPSDAGAAEIGPGGSEEDAAFSGAEDTESQVQVGPVPATPRFRVGQVRPARPTFKQTVLRAAEERFRGDPVREPLTERQVDDLLVLLHQRGQNRSLVDATYDYLRRGMSWGHAKRQIEKLRGTLETRTRLSDTRMAA